MRGMQHHAWLSQDECCESGWTHSDDGMPIPNSHFSLGNWINSYLTWHVGGDLRLLPSSRSWPSLEGNGLLLNSPLKN